ncbi:MAG TPA: dihydropteroate synthase [Spirochaetes bacterium]|nr:dihydropteroate synthase [Spirochaetota bacterium]
MGSQIRIMGILNVTPDSFYDGGRYAKPKEALNRAREMIAEGADIIDVGGESSRPGAVPPGEQEECDRVCPVIEALTRETALPLSVDTRNPAVAEAALKAGAVIVNDISGLGADGMPGVVSRYGAHVVIMHMKGSPETMQKDPVYEDVVGEVYGFLEQRSRLAVESGIDRDKIIVDPGIGFGKTMEHNYEILKNMEYFTDLGFPVLVGLSRKSLIGNLYPGADRLPATIALNSAAVMRGASILRVHDVREHVLAVKALENLKRAPKKSGRTV